MVFGLFTSPKKRTRYPPNESREVHIGGRDYALRITRRRNARRLTMRVRDRAIRITAPRGAGRN